MREKLYKTKLGLFVILGTLIFSVSLYFIGDKENLFEKTFKVNAVFENVNGLQEGNNVRFSGINVGTVKGITIIDENSVLVEIALKKDVVEFVKKDAIVSIGTDGLMGNKLVNIGSGSPESLLVKVNDTLPTLPSPITEDVIRKLELSNNNIVVITKSLMDILNEIQNGKGTISNLISDTSMAKNLDLTFESLKRSSIKTALILDKIEKQVNYINLGEGSLGEVLTDTVFAQNIKIMMEELMEASKNTREITEETQLLLENVKNGHGAAGTILNDTSFSSSLEESIESIRLGSESFNRNMEALENSIFLRGYLKRQEREKKKKIKIEDINLQH